MAFPPPNEPPSMREPLPVNLALQGGGAHGAFTWGVLDRLLEEPWLRIDGISAASAGAINAALLADGQRTGGARGAKDKLADFWQRIATAATFSPFRRSALDLLLGRWSLDLSPAFLGFELVARTISPYGLHAPGLNPLRDIVAATIDVGSLSRSDVRLFVSATNVRTGRGRVFRNDRIDADVLMASACVPTLFQAITIDGEPYWDGGYSGNPALAPLVRDCRALDTILVEISPMERPGAPVSAREISSRLNEVAFNATLLKELRMMSLLRRIPEPADDECARWSAMRMHHITSERMSQFGYSSKLNAEWDFLCMLRDEGRQAAQAFLDRHAADLGVRSSLDVDGMLGDV